VSWLGEEKRALNSQSIVPRPLLSVVACCCRKRYDERYSIYYAARNGDVNTLKKQLSHGGMIEATDAVGIR
jgi:hypothetical protein